MQNQISNNWHEEKLGNVIEINARQIGSGYPYDVIDYIDISSVGTGVLESSTTYKLSKAPGRAKRLVLDGDTILSTVRPNRRSFLYIKDPKVNLVVSTGFAVLSPKRNIIDPKFLYYLITRKSFSDYLSSNVKGSAYPAISTDVIKDAVISLPDIYQQKKIVTVLSTIDEKIEMNNKIVKTLEEMSQAIFKEWFIKFRFPGYERAKFVESELGKIPDGWSFEDLHNVFDFLEGPGIRNWQYTNGGFRFINIRLITDNDIDIGASNFISIDEAERKYKHFQLKEDDMVVSTSGTLGRSAIVRKEHLPLLLNTSVIRFRPVDGKSYGFMYLFLNSRYFQNKITTMASGSAQPNFGPIHLNQIKVLKPESKLLVSFCAIINPLYKQIINKKSENQKLVQTRDLLLPKLMRGEIRV